MAFPLLIAAQDPREIVRRAVEADSHNYRIAQDYTYLQREERRTLDASGNVKDVKVETYDVTLIDGSQYRRLVARGDQPLSASELRKEEEKEKKEAARRRKESPSQRQKRLAGAEARRRKNREQYADIVDAFNFRLAGRDAIAGAPVWIVEGTPRAGFRARASAGRKLLPKIDCRLWISMSDYGWARIEIETLDTVSFGLAVVRIAKGSRITIEQTRLNGEIWLPSRVVVTAGARLFLVRNTRINLLYDFTDYRKFQSDSRIVDIPPRP